MTPNADTNKVEITAILQDVYEDVCELPKTGYKLIQITAVHVLQGFDAFEMHDDIRRSV